VQPVDDNTSVPGLPANEPCGGRERPRGITWNVDFLPVAEPGRLAMLGSGLTRLARLARRRARATTRPDPHGPSDLGQNAPLRDRWVRIPRILRGWRTFFDTNALLATTSPTMVPPALSEAKGPERKAHSGGGFFDEKTLDSLRRSRRILVLGSSGAGKSHLSRDLRAILGIDVIDLDDHFWRPDGQPRDESEWRRIVRNLAARDSWIMDGTYERSLDLRMPRADAIILLDCPSELCLERVLKREKRVPSPQWSSRSDATPAQIDPYHVQYVSQYATVTRPVVLEHIERHGRDKTVVVVQAPEAVEPFISALQHIAA